VVVARRRGLLVVRVQIVGAVTRVVVTIRRPVVHVVVVAPVRRVVVVPAVRRPRVTMWSIDVTPAISDRKRVMTHVVVCVEVQI